MMKRIQCELCGSVIFIKEGGMFVCQECGTKYSVEEARKMMSDDGASAANTQADSSRLTDNYLSIAKNALAAGNNAEAVSYCNKIIEIDPSSYEAWFIKGKAAGWQSTLANQRLGETINAFSNALTHCPAEKKHEIAKQCQKELEDLHKSIITLRMNSFGNHPADNNLASLTSDVKSIISNTYSFLQQNGLDYSKVGKTTATIIANKIIGIATTVFENYIGDGHPNDYELQRFISETDVCLEALRLASLLYGTYDTDDLELYDFRALVYDSMVQLNTAVIEAHSFDYNFDLGIKTYTINKSLTESAKSIRIQNNQQWTWQANDWRAKKHNRGLAIQAEKARKAQEEAGKRFETYWKTHPDEQMELEIEWKTLEEHINNLTSSCNKLVESLRQEIEAVPGQNEIDNLDAMIKKLSEDQAAISIYKGKERKELQDQIDQVAAQKKTIQDRMSEDRAPLWDKISALQNELQRKTYPLKNRVNQIYYELTRAR